jgi:hypothetical protein
VADISKSGTPSLATNNPGGECWVGSGLKAGEAIAAGDVCYIASTGKVMKSIGTTTNAAAKAQGIAQKAAALNEAVTIMRGVDMHYGSGLTPGAPYYVSATSGGGRLADAASTGGTGIVAFAIDATRIRFIGSTY